MDEVSSWKKLFVEIQSIHEKLNSQGEMLNEISRKMAIRSVEVNNNYRHGYEASDETSTDSLSYSTTTENTESPYDAFLQSEHVKFVERLHINAFLDNLLEDYILSPSDHENIRKLSHNRKDQVRFLLMRLRRYGPQVFQRFKTILEKTDVEWQDSISDIRSNGECFKQDCIACIIAKKVDIRDCIDVLYSKGLAHHDTMETMLSSLMTSETVWRLVFRDISEHGGLWTHMKTLQEAIPSQYIDLKEKLGQMRDIVLCSSCKGTYPVSNSRSNTSSSDSIQTVQKDVDPNQLSNVACNFERNERLESQSKNDDEDDQLGVEENAEQPKKVDLRRFGFAPESMSSNGTQTLDDLLRFHENEKSSSQTLRTVGPGFLRRTQSDRRGDYRPISASVRRSQSDRTQKVMLTRAPIGGLAFNDKSNVIRNFNTSILPKIQTEPRLSHSAKTVYRSQSDRRENRKSYIGRRRHTLSGMNSNMYQ
ncbi:uncharacterized protein LOC134263279 [Saccostrea cucullata]|uniref:uncharacterized protein LOC134263279 n=1 Tax=Saccostrea cuccullata TaxID=36930 RepID=UPI002ED4E3A6